MNVYKFIEKSRAVGILLTYGDIFRYIRLYGTDEEKENFFKHHLIKGLDAQHILDKSNAYLETREICAN